MRNNRNGTGQAHMKTKAFPLTMSGLADRFIAANHDRVKWCKPLGGWMISDGRAWLRDSTRLIERLAMRIVGALPLEAMGAAGEADRRCLEDFALESQSCRVLTGMLKLAQPRLTVTPDVFDRNDWLFNCRNGTIDLRTGELRKHHRADMITKISPVDYEPAATCPRWHAFLDQVLEGDSDLISMVQLAVGHSLTGETSEEVMFVIFGDGANGKSVFLNTVASVLGTYARTAARNTFWAHGPNAPADDLAHLRGARLVLANEMHTRGSLTGRLINAMTRTDKISARLTCSERFEFKPTAKVWLTSTYTPDIIGAFDDSRLRIRPIPFAVTISEQDQDRQLPEKLKEEWQGILAWAVQGCLYWQRAGLRHRVYPASCDLC